MLVSLLARRTGDVPVEVYSQQTVDWELSVICNERAALSYIHTAQTTAHYPGPGEQRRAFTENAKKWIHSMEMLGASLINDWRRAGVERCNNDVENIPLILTSTWAGPITQQSWTKSRMWISCTKTRCYNMLCRLPGLSNIVQKEMIFTFLGQTAVVTRKKFVERVLTPALRTQILIVGHVLHFSFWIGSGAAK